MVKESKTKKVVALFFVVSLFIILVRSDSYNLMTGIAEYLGQDLKTESGKITMDNLESEYASSIWNHTFFIDLNGAMAKRLGMQGFYSDMGMYVTNENYIVSSSTQTTTDYEVDEILSFRDFLNENNINLIYVNEPTKYIDDDLFSEQFGVETYSNRNMDLFLQRISDAGVYTIDLRDELVNDGLNVSDMFYRTDHHWTVEAGLWAVQKIAQGMNDFCGYSIDTSIYNKENYNFTYYKNCWLGEQGRKMAQTYVGLDDYVEIKPKFETNYLFKSGDGFIQGTFDNFIDETNYDLERDVYEGSWHYAYSQMNCINNNVDYGKVLILGDSYENVTEPFLTLGVHEVDALILRSKDSDFSLRSYIIENGYDTVLICYAQFMVGAHDDPNSANYRMFAFEY